MHTIAGLIVLMLFTIGAICAYHATLEAKDLIQGVVQGKNVDRESMYVSIYSIIIGLCTIAILYFGGWI